MTLNEYIEQQKKLFQDEFTEHIRGYCKSGCGCEPGVAYHDGSCAWTSYTEDESREWLDSILQELAQGVAAEFEKLVPGETGTYKGGYVKDPVNKARSEGHNSCREETLSNIRAFIGETK